jgi:hypothetical protein
VLQQRSNPIRRLVEDFDHWRRIMIPSLAFASAVGAAYWLAWTTDRSLVASDNTSEYLAFEQAFPMADGWLVACALLGAVQLRRRRPSALIWLVSLGGAGIYLWALDVLFNLENAIYAKGRPGSIELAINIATLSASAMLLFFAWHFRRELLVEDREIRPD